MEVQIDDLKYKIDKEKFTASVIGSSESVVNVVIPKSILINNQEYFITKIDQYSFQDRKSLKRIDFSKHSKVEKIADYGFQNSSLESIKIPKSVINIDTNAFSGATELKHVFLSPQNKTFSFFNDQILVAKSSQENENYDTIIFIRPDSEKVFIPSFIYDLDFKLLKSIKKITFSADIDIYSIPDEAFSESLIEEITIPNSVVCIESKAFFRCYNLKFVNFYNGSKLNKIEKSAFYHVDIEKFEFPWELNTIEEYAFAYCLRLKKLKIPENSCLSIIGQYAFTYTPIQSIYIPSGVEEIHEGAFHHCENLESVKFAEDSRLLSISQLVFACTNIAKITIPTYVKRIEKNTFSKCPELKIVDFQNNSYLESIEKRAFFQSPIQTLYIPKRLEELQNGWCKETMQLNNVIVSEENKNFMVFDNKILIGKSSIIEDSFDTIYFANRHIKRIIIPSFIKRISSYAFSQCIQLRKVDFSQCNNLKLIESNSFSYTPIKKLIIPDKVTKIEKKSFCNCNHLKSVLFLTNSTKEKNLAFIGKKAFSNTNIKKLCIPSSVIEIGEKAFKRSVKYPIFSSDSKAAFLFNAFSFSNVVKLKIPSNVKNITDNYFGHCFDLQSIEFFADDLTFQGNCFNKCGELKIISCPNSKKVSLMFENIYCYLYAHHNVIWFFCANTQIYTPFIKLIEKNNEEEEQKDSSEEKLDYNTISEYSSYDIENEYNEEVSFEEKESIEEEESF